MKKILPLISLILCLSCKVEKISNSLEAHHLQLMLDSSISPYALTEDFKELGVEKLTLTSKSQPLYSAMVQLPPEEFKKLLEKLQADERVISVKVQDRDLKKSQSTNSGYGKSRPKIKKP